MRNKEITRLITGFRRFREKYFNGDDSLYQKLSEKQDPKTLIIACSDSRVDPALISSASPGELFVVRNVANLVPPYESTKSGRHGVSAAIEFAVVNLKVENIVILGHRQCGGIRALMSDEPKKIGQRDESFVSTWMEIAHSARDSVLQKFGDRDFETQCRACEMAGIVTSIENLRTFPFVQKALEKKKISILGIYFDLKEGQLLEYVESSRTFEALQTHKSFKNWHENIVL